MSLYAGTQEIAGSTGKIENILSGSFIQSTVNTSGVFTYKNLTKDPQDYDFIVIIARGDWNSVISIVMPKAIYGYTFNINIVNPSNANYYVRGHVKIDGQRLAVMLTQKAGWSGIGFSHAFGVKL